MLLPAAALAAWTGQPNPQSEAAVLAMLNPAEMEDYDKGYLRLDAYVTWNANNKNRAGDTTEAMQQALDDAYEHKKVLLIPSGTYYVNDTLRAWSATGTPSGMGVGYTAGMPHPQHCAMVGSTVGSRPTIKLADSASGFDDGSSVATAKSVVEFKNFRLIPGTADPDWNTEQPGAGYGQMIRNVDIHCNGKAGAIGLYFNQAEDASIEDVTITATGSFAGIRGLPARSGAAAVNIIVKGGQYGIDTLGQENPSSTVTNVQLLDQTASAVRHDGFGVLTLVGFKIRKSGASPALVTVANANNAHKGAINLIDGIIELDAVPAVAAIDNTNARNFYARKVYVKTSTAAAESNKLVKSGGTVTTSVATRVGHTSAYWVRLTEYGFRRNTGPDSTPEAKDSQSLINGTLTTGTQANDPAAITLEPLVNGAVPTPPANLLTRHSWVRKPFFKDWDARDLVDLDPSGVITGQFTTAGITTYQVNSAAFQAFLDDDDNRKIFLRAGIYQLSDTITLNEYTVLFGADRYLTRIETASSWRPTSNTPGSDGVPMITTVDDAEATTYLGELAIGVYAGGGVSTGAAANVNDRFNALLWKAGRKSMVHIAHPYAQDNGQPPYATNAHSLVYITGSGGGRWYNAGNRKAFLSNHPDFRMLRVKDTTQPLSIYGLDLEHGSGPRDYGLFENAHNVRIYGVKNEMHFPANPANPQIVAWSAGSSVLTFENSTNVGLFGVSALRNGLTAGKGLIQFFDCTQALATLLTPQKDDYLGYTGTTPPKPAGPIVLEKISGSVTGSIAFPNIVSLYKDGDLDDDAVVHGFAGDYGP